MRTRLLPMEGYNAYYYHTDKYTTMNINLLFSLECTKKNVMLVDLLCDYMQECNSKYKNYKDLSEKAMELYSINNRYRAIIDNDSLLFKVSISMFDPKLVKDDYFDEAMNYVKTSLYEPYFIDGKPNKKIYDKIKNILIENLKDIVVHPNAKAEVGYYKTAYPNTSLLKDKFSSVEEIEEIFNDITENDLYKMYREIIDNSFVGMSIMGNLSDDNLKVIKGIFKFKNIKREKIKRHIKYDIDEFKEVTEKDPEIKESTLYVMYKCNDYKVRDVYTYQTIVKMINYEVGRLMHKILRDKYNLIYSGDVRFMPYYGTMDFVCNINSSNKNKCLDAIEEILETIKNKEETQVMLDKTVEKLNDRLYVFDENKWNYISLLDAKIRGGKRSPLSYKNKVAKLKTNDIIDGINRLEKKVVYLYEGTKE